ncbi:hypothetical protein EJB05_19053, partial [Eragrostis curvula]
MMLPNRAHQGLLPQVRSVDWMMDTMAELLIFGTAALFLSMIPASRGMEVVEENVQKEDAGMKTAKLRDEKEVIDKKLNADVEAKRNLMANMQLRRSREDEISSQELVTVDGILLTKFGTMTRVV